jgi:purine-cytosine permease-like protein
MKEKFLPFIGGFILTLGLILLSSFYFTRSAKVNIPANDFLDEGNLEQLKGVISTLNNYGDLPKNVDSGSIGKNNPFN